MVKQPRSSSEGPMVAAARHWHCPSRWPRSKAVNPSRCNMAWNASCMGDPIIQLSAWPRIGLPNRCCKWQQPTTRKSSGCSSKTANTFSPWTLQHLFRLNQLWINFRSQSWHPNSSWAVRICPHFLARTPTKESCILKSARHYLSYLTARGLHSNPSMFIGAITLLSISYSPGLSHYTVSFRPLMWGCHVLSFSFGCAICFIVCLSCFTSVLAR